MCSSLGMVCGNLVCSERLAPSFVKRLGVAKKQKKVQQVGL